MTAPPFEDTLNDGMAQLRRALDHAPEAAREEVKQVLDSDELVTRVVNIVVPVMDDRFRRKYYRSMIIGVGVLLTIFAVSMIAAFQQIGTVATGLASNDAAIQRSQATIAAFQDQLNLANDKLKAQGLPTVQGPTGTVEPGTPEQAKLINAAATASTLASLPKEQLIYPTAAQLAAAVATYIQANPVVVPPDQIIAGVAAYLERNPVPAGKDGAPGEPGKTGAPGPPPTAAEIRQAFRDEVVANPNLLCPLGGSYGSRTVALADGGSTEHFGCFGANSAPPPTTTAPAPAPAPAAPNQPAPTTTPAAGPQGGAVQPTAAPPPTTTPNVLNDLLGVA